MNSTLTELIDTPMKTNEKVFDMNDENSIMRMFQNYLDNNEITPSSTVDVRSRFVLGLINLCSNVESVISYSEEETVLDVNDIFQSKRVETDFDDDDISEDSPVIHNDRFSAMLKRNGVKNAGSLRTIIVAYKHLTRCTDKLIQEEDMLERVTDKMLTELYLGREKFWEDLTIKTVSWDNKSTIVMKSSNIGSLYALFLESNAVKANSFMEELIIGGGCADSIVTSLRRKLVQDYNGAKMMTFKHRNALTIKAWNYFRNDVTAKHLSINTSEIFPVAL